MKKRADGTYTIEAPCKINLHLKIGEKQSDGFHNLESIFATLAFGDTLCFEEVGKTGQIGNIDKKDDCNLSIKWENIAPEHIPNEKNLVLRAVSLFRERAGYENALNIRLTKRIPPGSGLGGASSDAASTLLALNSLSKTAICREELRELALKLGSDVPFFLSGGLTFVSGRGEIIESIDFPEAFSPEKLWVVLAKPPFSSPTPAAYRLLDEAREKNPLPVNPKKNISKEQIIRALEENPLSWPYYNDFLPVFLARGEGEDAKKAQCLKAILDDLAKAGAAFSGLSGSGSCCFGVFSARESAEIAEKALSGQGNYSKMTFFLAKRQNRY